MKPPKDPNQKLKVLYVSPTYFDPASVVGGGERYALELARAMSSQAETVLLSFGKKHEERLEGDLRHVLIRSPWSLSYLKWIRWAKVIHCHQPFNFATDLALLCGQRKSQNVFLSDLGGAQRQALSYHWPLQRRARGMLLISEYSKKLWEKKKKESCPEKKEVIYGGVDLNQFVPRSLGDTKSKNFVCRPHRSAQRDPLFN